MIKHIVMWRLKENYGSKSTVENALIIKEKLEALNGKIDGLIKLEVGLDFSRTLYSCDLVLYSEFVTKEHLEKYQDHPEHKAIMPIIMEMRDERRVVDYEI